MENMKGMICAGALMMLVLTANSQKKWDGGAGDSSWTSAANWHPDGVPVSGEDVLLDHSILDLDYEVRLPIGTNIISLNSLILRPGSGKSIRLVIPTGNKAAPALAITGPGESLRIDSGAVLHNASGAPSGDPLQLTGWMRISNGGRYIHATPRANARLIDRLSTSPGTSTGVFEFDVPGASGYTVSLTGNTFGSLVFSAKEAGGLKSYSGSGSADLVIRGDLIVHTGAGLTSTLTANIRVDRHILIPGVLSLQPATAGSTGRSIILNSAQTGNLEGANIQWHQHFREIVIGAGHQTLMRSNLSISLSTQKLRVLENGFLSMDTHAVNGSGSLEVNAGAWIGIGHPAGIKADGATGNIRTGARSLHAGAHYIFDGNGDQQTGDGLPDTISTLRTDKPAGVLQLSKSIQVTQNLDLLRGIIITSDSCLLDFQGDKISNQPNAFGMDSCGSAAAFVDGPFRRRIYSSGKLRMPIGKNGIFNPIIFNRTGDGLLVCRASYTNGQAPMSTDMADPNIYRINGAGYWTIQIEQALKDTLLTPEFGWSFSGDSLSRMRWMDSLRIVYRELSGGGWMMNGSSPTIIEHDLKTGVVRGNQPIKTSAFIAAGMTGAAVGLPINEIKLSAQRIGKTSKLEWETIGHSDATRFFIKRNVHQLREDTLGTLAVTHTLNKSRFFFVDKDPSPGWNTYKVCAAETDKENTICSPIVSVYHPPSAVLRLFPVPAIDRLHWTLSEIPDAGWIRMIDANGRVISKQRISNAKEGHLDIRHFTPGIYHLQVPIGGTVIRRSFLKID